MADKTLEISADFFTQLYRIQEQKEAGVEYVMVKRSAYDTLRERAEALQLELDHLRPEWEKMRQERDEAQAQLAAVPIESLVYCFRTQIEDREDADWEEHTNVVEEWIDAIVAERLAQLRPQQEAQP